MRGIAASSGLDARLDGHRRVRGGDVDNRTFGHRPDGNGELRTADSAPAPGLGRALPGAVDATADQPAIRAARTHHPIARPLGMCLEKFFTKGGASEEGDPCPWPDDTPGV